MNEAFERALKQVTEQGTPQGIGTLGEKTVHAVLKYYYEPCPENHEVKIGTYYADIVGEDGIIEIQTAGFDKLRKKLMELLAVARVTVVYPISRTTMIHKVDPDTGQVLSIKKSPKRGSPYLVFKELYKIKGLLTKPNFSLCIALLDVCEYRVPTGPRRAQKLDRVPTDLIDEIYFFTPADYAYLLPEALPSPFTKEDFAKACKIPPATAGCGVNVLTHLGILRVLGKIGNRNLYVRAEA